MPPRPPTYELTGALLVRGVALVYLIAALSLWPQLDGLIGPDGLLPLTYLLSQGRVLAQDYALTGIPTLDRLALYPTLAWFLPWETAGSWLAGLTAAAALAALAGLRPGPALAVAWVGWLSLVVAGQTFLAFQWDALLLEVGFATLLIARWGNVQTAAPVEGIWLLRWILFRLVFFSGVVKLTSGDPTWRDGTAMSFHYLTQPLPNALGWWAWQLPGWWHRVETFVMFIIELPVALLILGPRRFRPAVLAAVAGLMLTLAATGSYGWFQVLSLVLCLSLLDDDHWRRLRPAWKPRRAPAPPPWSRRAVQATAGVLFAVSLLGLPPRYAGVDLPAPLNTVRAAAARARVVSHYGLFARMTTERPIPALEVRWGDGEWTELTWAWQTSDVHAGPAQVAPHMPRLDWMLWFAGLSDCRDHQWARNLLRRVVAGSAPVGDLIGDLRLAGTPPDQARFTLYRWTFTASGSPEAAAGQWWTRTAVSQYCATVTREAAK